MVGYLCDHRSFCRLCLYPSALCHCRSRCKCFPVWRKSACSDHFLHLIILAVIILILIHLNTKTLSFTGLQRCVYVLLSVFGTFVAYYLLSIVLHYTAGISEKNLIDELILILFAFLFFFFLHCSYLSTGWGCHNRKI